MTKHKPALGNSASDIRRGVMLMVVGSLIIPGLDAAAKVLAQDYLVSAIEIAFLRFLMQSLFVLPVLLAVDGPSALRVQRLGLNLLRGVLLGTASVFFFSALKFIPLADATAIYFVEPMCVTLLAAVILKEKLDARRIFAVAVGFAGAMIIIRPSFATLGPVAVLPLITAALVALYGVLSRHLAASSTPLAMHFYAGVGGSVALGIGAVAGSLSGDPEFSMTIPTGGNILFLFLLVGLFATVGHLLFIQAYRLAPASLIAPFGYIELASATILGFVVFGEFPDLLKWVGIAVIVASGVFLFWQEQRRGAPDPQAFPVEHP